MSGDVARCLPSGYWGEVGLGAPAQLLATREIGDSLSLYGHLVVESDDECDPRVGGDVAVLARASRGVEHDLCLIGGGHADQGCLRRPVLAATGDHC